MGVVSDGRGLVGVVSHGRGLVGVVSHVLSVFQFYSGLSQNEYLWIDLFIILPLSYLSELYVNQR